MGEVYYFIGLPSGFSRRFVLAPVKPKVDKPAEEKTKNCHTV